MLAFLKIRNLVIYLQILHFYFLKKIKNPIEISTSIKENLISINLFREINIAGPGFLNFKINPKSIVNYISEIIKENENYGKINPCNKKVLVEFVSANPQVLLR